MLQLGDKKISAPGRSNGFLAQLDQNGICLQLNKIPGNAIPFNCHVNSFNDILVSGIFTEHLSMNGHNLKGSSKDQTFLANFNDRGQCQWLKSINMNGQVSRIRSDHNGAFYMPGSFNTYLAFQGDTLYTRESFDQDGFLLKLDRKGNKQWLKQFGNKGTIKYGYRTGEGIIDVGFDPEEHIVIAARFEHRDTGSLSFLNQNESLSTLDLIKLKPDGTILTSKNLLKSKNETQAHALVVSKDDNFWLTGNSNGQTEIHETDYHFSNSQSFILKLDPDWELSELILPSHGNNTIFRVAYPMNKGVYFTGHYQSNLSIDDKSISNDGRHGIFLFKKAE